MTQNTGNGAASRFTTLDGNRSQLKTFWEQYAAYTFPYLCPDDTFDGNQYRMSEVYDSVVAKGVNHLANRLMVTLFGSSNPFCRLKIPKKLQAQLLSESNMTEDDLDELLSEGEQEMLEVLAESGIRTKLFEVLKHLIVIGNVAIDRAEDYTILPVKDYVVVRSVSGRVLEVIFRTNLSYDELSDAAKDKLPKSVKDEKVLAQYVWCKFSSSGYTCTKWVNDNFLGDEFTQTYTEKDFPYSILTWVLPAKCNYGVGLIEEHRGDVFTMDILSESMSDGAILASQYRWRVSPGGGMDINEFKDSVNGDALPGEKDDIALVTADNTRQLDVIMQVSEKYERRLAEVFLQNSALVRQAERVTAEEIRMMAQEMDTALGGVYTRLSMELQKPLALWLLPRTGSFKKGAAIEPVVITGLDALSRTADTERLLRFLTNINQIATLPPETQDYLKPSPIIAQLAAGEGLASRKYVNTADEAATARDSRMQQQAAAEAAARAPQQPQPM